MVIDQEMMARETRAFLSVLFNLPEVEKVAIKEIVISSIEDEEHIEQGLALCYHDRFSDVDLSVVVRINPIDYYGDMPFYSNFLPRLQLENELLGMNFSTRFNLGMHEECLRICLKSGYRMDLVCWVYCEHNAPLMPASDRRVLPVNKQDGKLWDDWHLDKTEQFWFIAVQALGKLMRKDYLIADHLAHMLIMESLVVQMEMRDNLYATTIHRYGYAEELAYLEVDLKEMNLLIQEEDAVYERIAKRLYRAIVSYDILVQQANPVYESQMNTFLAIWKAYIS